MRWSGPIAGVVIAGNAGFMAIRPGSAQRASPAPRKRPATGSRPKCSPTSRPCPLVQQIVDSLFSFGELGYQEVETSRYLTGILEKHGFKIERGIAGMPTAWVARWGRGKPVIALGSDIDGIPQASQKPGVAYRDPLVPGAPGHGEGHNSGQAVNIAAALAVKALMERDKLPGTLVLWPGVAEELRRRPRRTSFAQGFFKDVDVVSLLARRAAASASRGARRAGTGLVSVEYTFQGESAHSAGAPWRGRSALDAVELMNVGWNFRREHLRLQHRSHYVIRNGGDQPNVVPSRTRRSGTTSARREYQRIKELWETGDAMAQGAALMTGTTLAGTRVLGAAWPRISTRRWPKPCTRTSTGSACRAGTRPIRRSRKRRPARAEGRREGARRPRSTKLATPVKDEDNRGGGSDDIGDVSWVVPTITLRYPSNIPEHARPQLVGRDRDGHADRAQRRDRRRQGAGADDGRHPDEAGMVEDAWKYFREVQTQAT